MSAHNTVSGPSRRFAIVLTVCHCMCQMVKLVREPLNPYDKFAVRVDNVLGEKVGHLSRQIAAVVRLQSLLTSVCTDAPAARRDCRQTAAWPMLELLLSAACGFVAGDQPACKMSPVELTLVA